MLKTDLKKYFSFLEILHLEVGICVQPNFPIVILSLQSMEPRLSEATRLIKVLIEGPRVCCGGGRVAVNCGACVIPVSCALTLSLRVCVCSW